MADAAAQAYLRKSEESLAGAESELAAGRGNNATSRAYYAAFQAAVAALLAEDEAVVLGAGGTISHKSVAARFAGLLVRRRKRYPASLSRVLQEALELRHRADYWEQPVSVRQAATNLREVQILVEAVTERLRGRRER